MQLGNNIGEPGTLPTRKKCCCSVYDRHPCMLLFCGVAKWSCWLWLHSVSRQGMLGKYVNTSCSFVPLFCCTCLTACLQSSCQLMINLTAICALQVQQKACSSCGRKALSVSCLELHLVACRGKHCRRLGPFTSWTISLSSS